MNKKYEVNKKLKKIAGAKSLNPTEVKEVADKLWDDVSVIDEYLLQCKVMPEKHREIITRTFKDIYMSAKKSGALHRTL